VEKGGGEGWWRRVVEKGGFRKVKMFKRECIGFVPKSF